MHTLWVFQFHIYPGSIFNKQYDIAKLCEVWPKKIFIIRNEIFLVLMRLRLKLREEDIAHIVGLSVSHISRIYIAWFDFLHASFRQFPIWPSRLLIDEQMPRSFKQKYPTTRVMIDCTELYTRKAECDVLHIQAS